MTTDKEYLGDTEEIENKSDDLNVGEDELSDDYDEADTGFDTLISDGAEKPKAKIPDSVGSPLELAKIIVHVLDSKKARGLKLLHVGDKTVIADYFVLCTGTSNTQIRALSAELEDELKKSGIEPGHIEGYNEASWIIMDYASVIVHIFNRDTRNFYNLEKLWNEAEEIDISELTD